jgi:hypothetical protein
MSNCPFGRSARSRRHITFFVVLVDVEALTFNLGLRNALLE